MGTITSYGVCGNGAMSESLCKDVEQTATTLLLGGDEEGFPGGLTPKLGIKRGRGRLDGWLTWEGFLLCKFGDLSSNPQHPDKKPKIARTFNLSTRETGK